MLAHQPDALHSGPGVGVEAALRLDEPVAGGGLDEGHARLRADFAEPDHLGVDKKVIFKNHFKDAAGADHRLVDKADFAGHVVPLTALDLAHVDYHVDLGGPGEGGRLGLHHLDASRTVAVRETDHRADLHPAPLQHRDRLRNAVGFDAGSRHLEVAGQLQPRLDARVIQKGLQQRMVDQASNGRRGIINSHDSRDTTAAGPTQADRNH